MIYGYIESAKHFHRVAIHANETKQNMFSRNVIVIESARFLHCILKGLLCFRCKFNTIGVKITGSICDKLDNFAHTIRYHADFMQNVTRYTAFFIQ